MLFDIYKHVLYTYIHIYIYTDIDDNWIVYVSLLCLSIQVGEGYGKNLEDLVDSIGFDTSLLRPNYL